MINIVPSYRHSHVTGMQCRGEGEGGGGADAVNLSGIKCHSHVIKYLC